MAEFKEFIFKFNDRIQCVVDLFNGDEIYLLIDRLKKKKTVDHELLFFKSNQKEWSGLFVFGSDFFQKELSEQEFKKVLGLNGLNIKILRAYKTLKRKQRKVKVSEILTQIQDKQKDSLQLHVYLRRILTLSYYLNWNIEKDPNDFEGDSYIEIPDRFLTKLKQRFNFDQLSAIYENKEVFVFINSRGKLNLVFKDKDKFTQEDLEEFVVPAIKKIFSINKVSLK